MVARTGQRQQGKGLGRLPGGERHRSDSALERGDPLLQHVLGGVVDPGVDIAGLGQREQIRGVLVSRKTNEVVW